MDNGKEFQSQSLKDICAQLGITPEYCPPRKPWFKGTVERTFRTINQQLLHKTPGTTFSNIVDKKDYDPEKNAIVGYHAFLKMMHEWIIDQYLQQPHRGVKGIPSDLWRSGITKWGMPALLHAIPDWRIILNKLKEGSSIQRAGIQYKQMHYNSGELQELKHRLLKKGTVSVRFKYDPYDMSTIFVYDEPNRRYLEVPNTDQAYSKGLTEFSHDCILKRLRHANSRASQLALAQAKEKLMEEVAKEMKLTKGARAAAFTQLSSAQLIEQKQNEAAMSEQRVARQASETFKAISETTLTEEWGIF
ncbi:Mu transposase C-terminal domain-containing protein [Paenibacillus humicus]|uniref:Mu transposase C-terminal domain-containing protein n=1 Tax=Paenibacillus humicus TaxID=412861 RepID=UPI003F164A70